jgi:2-aminoethylphosphonate-pyruvate transaminase
MPALKRTSMATPRKILLNPGPCTTAERVKQALAMADICPREKEFGELTGRVRTVLAELAHASATHTAVLIPGSGKAAVEAVLASCVGPDDRVLIVDNGAYGRRAERIARTHGLAHRMLKLAWGEFPEPVRIAAMLREAPGCTHCFLVYHETTTGMLNPLAAVAALCRLQRHFAEHALPFAFVTPHGAVEETPLATKRSTEALGRCSRRSGPTMS